MTKVVIFRKRGLGAKTMPDVAKTMASVGDHDVVILRGDESPKDHLDAKYVFRWGCAAEWPSKDAKIFNTVPAIYGTSEKRNFRKKMAAEGIAPKFFEAVADTQKDLSKGMKFVVRPGEHQRSENVFLCENFGELQSAAEACGYGYYVSEFIQKDQEYRVFVAQNRAVWMIVKEPQDRKAVSWGCVTDGDFEYVGWEEWNDKVTEVALRAFDLSGLHFGAVDVLLAGTKAYALEVNTGPYMTPYYSKCVGRVFDFMIKKSGRFDLPEKYDWKSAIHPAIWSK